MRCCRGGWSVQDPGAFEAGARQRARRSGVGAQLGGFRFVRERRDYRVAQWNARYVRPFLFFIFLASRWLNHDGSHQKKKNHTVLVANTDAEGRMVMTDLLCQFKEEALKEDKPALLFTVATLTGHALRAYDGYGIALDNGFARRSKVSQRIFEAGHLSADPFEISTFRREDVGVVQPGSSSEDVVQANDKASTMTNRGHQYPAGFMLIASGLDKHGVHSAKPLGFTHMDVAGSAETIASKNWSLPRVTGSPVAALTGAFLIDY